jgi:hypothetical protein
MFLRRMWNENVGMWKMWECDECENVEMWEM